MKKDLDKLFSRSIETYYFLLLIVVIIKLLGGNYFEIVYNNRTINIINDFILYWRLENVWYAITLYVNVYVVMSITTNENNNKMRKYSLLITVVAMIFQILKTKINLPPLFVLFDTIYMFVFSLLYLKINNKPIKKYNIINYIGVVLIINITQLISICIRNVPINNTHGIIVAIILNLDYLLVLIIIHKLYFYKGGKNLWDLVVYSGSQKLTSSRNLLKDLLRKSQNKTTKSKEERITNAIYIPLYILWNMFTMFVIIAIAFLNDAFIEAIFITVAFWVNKYAFGKPFHFKSVAVCFVFSSFTYYVLTRITFKTETSFFIPIFLGVTLSYVTSHFIKKNTKLYKGMSEEELHEIVVRVEDDPIVLKILKQYYCDRLTDVQISRNVNYSIDSVRKKRQNVNKKLRNS